MHILDTLPSWRGGYALLPAPRSATELATFTADLTPQNGTLQADGLTIRVQSSKTEYWLGADWPLVFERRAVTVNYALLYAALRSPRACYVSDDDAGTLVLAGADGVIVLDALGGLAFRGHEIVDARRLARLLQPGNCRIDRKERAAYLTDGQRRIRDIGGCWFVDERAGGEWSPVAVALNAPDILASVPARPVIQPLRKAIAV